MIKQKLGVCLDCNNDKEVPIIAGRCKNHYWEHRRTVNASRSNSKKYIAPVSKHRLEALKKYRRIRDKFLKEHPVCMYPGCNSREVSLHHGRGRIGSFLTNKKYFKSLCWPHHEHIERHPEEAKQLGLSYSRNDKFLNDEY